MIDIHSIFATGELFDGHYKLIRQLNDTGDLDNVWLAIDVNTIDKYAAASDMSSGKLVAIKICFQSSSLNIEEEQRLQDEFDTSSQCHHPNLLPPDQYSICDDIYYLVFPYIEKETLNKHIGKNMSLRAIWKLIQDLASGLNELHTHQPPITHRNISPSNILVGDDENYILTNYGLHFDAVIEQGDENNVIQTKTSAYTAPERFNATVAFGPESDIWALGSTLYEVLSGNKPFGENGGKNQQSDTPLPPLPDQQPEIRDLVYACLNSDPQKRPTARQIKEAARHKKFHSKQEKTRLPKKDKKKAKRKDIKNYHGDQRHKSKTLPIIIASAVLLLVGLLAYFLIPNHDVGETSKEPEVSTIVDVNPCGEAVELLSRESTAHEGLLMLESLVTTNNAQATFLLSRLYFDTRETDTIFYDPMWERMRDNCGIIPDNKTSHKYLLDAFALDENDFMTLYHLGCDFKAGMVRGCERNLNYALWCFNHAESVLEKSGTLNKRYQHELDNGRDRISTSTYSPIKPKR